MLIIVKKFLLNLELVSEVANNAKYMYFKPLW